MLKFKLERRKKKINKKQATLKCLNLCLDQGRSVLETKITFAAQNKANFQLHFKLFQQHNT